MTGKVATVAAALLVLISGMAHAEADGVAFYAGAEARALRPPEASTLKVACRESVEGRYFQAFKDPAGRIVLVAFSDRPVKELEKAAFLEVRFRESGPTACPSPRESCTMDWGYIYDRNGDGRVDYVAFLYGAMALTPANPPPGFSATADEVDREGLVLWLNSSRLFFFHGADDDFNGTADLMVGPSGPAPRSVWFDSFAALKSTARNGKVDDAWKFRDSIDVRLGPPAVLEGGYLIDGKADSGDAWLAGRTDNLRRINLGVAACQLAPGAIAAAPLEVASKAP
jgi:hypothetical protein